MLKISGSSSPCTREENIFSDTLRRMPSEADMMWPVEPAPDPPPEDLVSIAPSCCNFPWLRPSFDGSFGEGVCAPAPVARCLAASPIEPKPIGQRQDRARPCWPFLRVAQARGERRQKLS